MDFVFGTLSTDELRILQHRMERTGVQHRNRIDPIDPLPGQAVTLTVTTGHAFAAEHVACYYTTDDSIPAGSRGQAQNGQVILLERIDVVWDNLAWGYSTTWRGVIPAQSENIVVRYCISAWRNDGEEIYADSPEVKITVEQAAAAYFRGEPAPEHPPVNTNGGKVFNYHVDTLSLPEWARNTIIYHVFVDRFYPGDGKSWLQPSDLRGFYGGTLWGVRDKLDYITDLGADCIWLSPTFVSPTHHGYDITDYMRIEPRLGGDEALHALVEAAHARGIRILLDLVCNHTSNEHPYFIDAHSNPDSSYRDWFIFDDSEIGYHTFFGVPTMPIINVHNPGARRWMIDVARYWLREFDVDGYRLDHANGTGPDFWSDFRAACRAEKPDCFCFGEVVESPDVQRAYIGRLDGLLDFHVEDNLRKTFARDLMTEVEFERFIANHLAYFPADFSLPTFVDNHDMDRFLYIADNDKDRLRRAAEAQFRLPGPPIIYYGTEIGMTQKHGKRDGIGLEESRRPMVWGEEQDAQSLTFYKQLIVERRARLSR